MPYLSYKPKSFRGDSLAIIQHAEDICNEYAAQGYELTLRQLYYQFVARGLIPNRQSEYKRLGNIVNDARMAGQIDWDHIVDRTRNLKTPASWDSPEAILAVVANQYREKRWRNQEFYVEVWVEKEALAGVVEQATAPWFVPTFACRGYVSQSEQWRSGQRLLEKIQQGKKPIILHLGDHDPSGLHMTKDNDDRIYSFVGKHIVTEMPEVSRATHREIEAYLTETYGAAMPVIRRLALNMNQVEEYNPPPNPAKETDSRFANYEAEYGDESWELDALPPDVLSDLITDAIQEYVDDEQWEADESEEEAGRELLKALSERYSTDADGLRSFLGLTED
jgi:hypothetical protein